MKGDTRCVDGRLMWHDPQFDDPELEGTVTQHLGYSQGKAAHFYTVRTPRLTFVADETRLVAINSGASA